MPSEEAVEGNELKASRIEKSVFFWNFMSILSALPILEFIENSTFTDNGPPRTSPLRSDYL